MLTARPRGVQARGDGPWGGERAPGGPTPHNGTPMSPPGSVSPRPLPVAIALAVTCARCRGDVRQRPSWRAAPGPRLRAARSRWAPSSWPSRPGRPSSLRPAAWPAAAGRAASPQRTLALSAPPRRRAVGRQHRPHGDAVRSCPAPGPEYLELFRRLHAALAPSGPLDGLVSLAVIAVLPALCEELVMRGVLLPSLARALPAAGAVIVSAALFAAMHGDAYPLRPSRSRSGWCSAPCGCARAPCGPRWWPTPRSTR